MKRPRLLPAELSSLRPGKCCSLEHEPIGPASSACGFLAPLCAQRGAKRLLLCSQLSRIAPCSGECCLLETSLLSFFEVPLCTCPFRETVFLPASAFSLLPCHRTYIFLFHAYRSPSTSTCFSLLLLRFAVAASFCCVKIHINSFIIAAILSPQNQRESAHSSLLLLQTISRKYFHYLPPSLCIYHNSCHLVHLFNLSHGYPSLPHPTPPQPALWDRSVFHVFLPHSLHSAMSFLLCHVLHTVLACLSESRGNMSSPLS